MRARWRRILLLAASLAGGLAMLSYLRQPPPEPIAAVTGDANYLANDNDARQACKQHRFKYFEDRHTRKIYDLFLIGTELDLLEIRLHELAPIVDYFIIIESNLTFTGQPKPLHLHENLSRFTQFHHKIIIHSLALSHFPPSTSPWTLESYSRNALFTHIFPHLTGPSTPSPSDIILISDVDELPRPTTLQLLKSCHFPVRTTLASTLYYYSFSLRHSPSNHKPWLHPQATYFTSLNGTLLPSPLRGGASVSKAAAAQYRVLPDAGWHCSTCFATIAEVQAKLRSFSHQEFNQPYFVDAGQIVRRVRDGVDIVEREGEEYVWVKENEDLPGWVKRNRERYAWLVGREGESAGFRDWDGGMVEKGDWRGEMPVVWPQ